MDTQIIDLIVKQWTDTKMLLTKGIHSAILFKWGHMKKYIWDDEKSKKLRKERGIDFEDIVILIEGGFVLAIIEHPNREKYSNQKIYVINVNSYAYCVPYTEDEQAVHLVTIFPSRKYTKIYLGGA